MAMLKNQRVHRFCENCHRRWQRWRNQFFNESDGHGYERRKWTQHTYTWRKLDPTAAQMLELAPKLVDMRETKHGGKSRLHFDVHLKWGTPNISIFTYVYRQLFSIGPSNWVNCCCFCFLSASFGEHWGCTWRTILKEDLLSSEAAAILGFGQSLMRTDFWSGSFVNDSKKIHITICLSPLKK